MISVPERSPEAAVATLVKRTSRLVLAKMLNTSAASTLVVLMAMLNRIPEQTQRTDRAHGVQVYFLMANVRRGRSLR